MFDDNSKVLAVRAQICW